MDWWRDSGYQFCDAVGIEALFSDCDYVVCCYDDDMVLEMAGIVGWVEWLWLDLGHGCDDDTVLELDWCWKRSSQRQGCIAVGDAVIVAKWYIWGTYMAGVEEANYRCRGFYTCFSIGCGPLIYLGFWRCYDDILWVWLISTLWALILCTSYGYLIMVMGLGDAMVQGVSSQGLGLCTWYGFLIMDAVLGLENAWLRLECRWFVGFAEGCSRCWGCLTGLGYWVRYTKLVICTRYGVLIISIGLDF